MIRGAKVGDRVRVLVNIIYATKFREKMRIVDTRGRTGTVYSIERAPSGKLEFISVKMDQQAYGIYPFRAKELEQLKEGE